jgi:hypothetical protein
MNRRQGIIGLGCVVMVWPLRAVAQKQKLRTIGLLSPFTREEAEPCTKRFGKGWATSAGARA